MNETSHQRVHFDKQANTYEELYGSKSKFEKVIVDKRRDIISSSPKVKKVLDLGCGTGTFSKQISQKGEEITAVDLSPKMLELAKKSAIENKITNTSFLQGDAKNIPTQSSYFNSVFCINTFYHVPNNKKVLEEIQRVLKPKGTAFVEFYNLFNPFVFVRVLLNFFVKNRPFVYANRINQLKKDISKSGFVLKQIKILSIIEASQAVRHWLPKPIFKMIMKYENSKSILPPMRCVAIIEKK